MVIFLEAMSIPILYVISEVIFFIGCLPSFSRASFTVKLKSPAMKRF